MAANSVEKELLDLETQYWTAVKAKDVDTVLSLSDDPCLVVGPRGVASIDNEKLRAMMESAAHSLLNFDLTEVQVRMLSQELGIVAYKADEEMIVEGKRVSVAGFHASTWIKRNGRWACSVHTEAVVGDVFGRDHQAA
jgi:ketosteroid isomerase-like protein